MKIASTLTQFRQRWGDAPVHSIGAALFARKDQIHFFREIGYRHNPFQHCPQREAHKVGKCVCHFFEPSKNIQLIAPDPVPHPFPFPFVLPLPRNLKKILTCSGAKRRITLITKGEPF